MLKISPDNSTSLSNGDKVKVGKSPPTSDGTASGEDLDGDLKFKTSVHEPLFRIDKVSKSDDHLKAEED